MSTSQLTLSEKLQCTDFTSALMRWQSVGELLTQASSSSATGDAQTIKALGVEQRKLLLEITLSDPEMLSIVKKHKQVLDDQYQSMLSSSQLTAEQKAQAEKLVQRAGNIQTFAEQSLSELEQEATKLLVTDLQEEPRKHPAIRGWSKAFTCTVCAGLIVGGVVTGQWEVAAAGLGISWLIDC